MMFVALLVFAQWTYADLSLTPGPIKPPVAAAEPPEPWPPLAIRLPDLFPPPHHDPALAPEPAMPRPPWPPVPPTLPLPLPLPAKRRVWLARQGVYGHGTGYHVKGGS